MKATKTEARYQDYPKAMQSCGGCTMFVKPDACTAVRGEVSRHGWCRFHEAKK